MVAGQSVVRLRSFAPAFAVTPQTRELAVRRFMTLLVDPPAGKAHGGTSYVCRAMTTAGELVALKRLRPLGDALGQHESELVRRGRERAFLEEYRNQLAASKLAGLPVLYGYAELDDGPAIVMEWVEGLTLRDARGLLPHAEGPYAAGGVTGRAVAEVGAAVLEVLTGLARRGLVHRDVSPKNIMLRTCSRGIADQFAGHSLDVVLIDFGSSTPPVSADSSLTAQTDIWRNGTPEYAPPEMLTHDVAAVGALRSAAVIDVYALCSVLYELYCGFTPFRIAERPGASAYRVKTESPLPDLIPRTRGDAELTEAIMSGIRGSQAARPRPDELLARLRRWMDA